MAVTSKKNSKNSRLDFGAALDSALFVDKDEDEQKPYNTYERTNSNPTIDVMQEPSQTKTTINDKIAEMKQLAVQMDQPIVHSINKSQEVNLAAVTNSNTDVEDDEDMFLAIVKGGRGVQRSVYFENDVYQYLKAKTKRYDVNFSNVVNLLIKYAIENMK